MDRHDVRLSGPRVAKVRRILHDVRSERDRRDLTQTEFWARLGVTQSAGSRFESGRALSETTQLLLTLEALGIIDDEDLTEAMAYVEAANVPKARRQPRT